MRIARGDPPRSLKPGIGCHPRSEQYLVFRVVLLEKGRQVRLKVGLSSVQWLEERNGGEWKRYDRRAFAASDKPPDAAPSPVR